jgi:hypothetical protein
VGRRKQRGSREKIAAKDRPPSSTAAPDTHPPLPPAHPPRGNVSLLIFSIALFLLWLIVLIILATYR